LETYIEPVFPPVSRRSLPCGGYRQTVLDLKTSAQPPTSWSLATMLAKNYGPEGKK